jgi:hypothetical protein
MNVACAYFLFAMENIVGHIRGPYVARALKTLPNLETVPADAIMEATMPGIGMVRFTARPHAAQARQIDALLLDGGESCGRHMNSG